MRRRGQRLVGVAVAAISTVLPGCSLFRDGSADPSADGFGSLADWNNAERRGREFIDETIKVVLPDSTPVVNETVTGPGLCDAETQGDDMFHYYSVGVAVTAVDAHQVMREVAEYWRSRGVTIVVYDDPDVVTAKFDGFNAGVGPRGDENAVDFTVSSPCLDPPREML